MTYKHFTIEERERIQWGLWEKKRREMLAKAETAKLEREMHKRAIEANEHICPIDPDD